MFIVVESAYSILLTQYCSGDGVLIRIVSVSVFREVCDFVTKYRRGMGTTLDGCPKFIVEFKMKGSLHSAYFCTLFPKRRPKTVTG